MSSLTLNLGELAGIVAAAVALAASDPAAISRIGTTWLATKVDLKPGEIRKFSAATDGSDDESGDN